MHPKSVSNKTISLVGIILIILFATIMLTISLQTTTFSNSASAATIEENMKFSVVDIGVYDDDSGEWTGHNGGASNKRLSFKFQFASDEFLSDMELLYKTSDTDWQIDGENNYNLKITNMPKLTNAEGKYEYIWTYPEQDPYNVTVRFKSIYVTTVGGSAEPITYEYEDKNQEGTPFTYNIIYKYSISENDIGIVGVVVEYELSPNTWEIYDTVENAPNNKWISTAIRFTITSINIQDNRGIDELFFYSVDEGITWHPIGDNILTLKEEHEEEPIQLDGPIRFKVIDADEGSYSDFYENDTDERPLYIKMDTASPEFEVRPTYTKIIDGEAVQFDYSKNMWSASDITFTIVPIGEVGISQVSYQYSVLIGGYWSSPADLPGVGNRYVLVVSKTTEEIRFAASSLAGKSVTKDGYSAQIDKVSPMVAIEAKDAVGTEIRSFGTPNGEGYRVGYASDSITFYIYNRDVLGADIIQDSTLTYECSYGHYSSSGELIIDGTLSVSSTPDGDYTFTDRMPLSDKQPITNRVYIFRLESASGLFDEKSFTATILYSDFEISIDIINISPNLLGWVNEPIPVYINAPIGERYTFAYGISSNPNFEKRFVWAADGSGDSRDIVEDVSAQYADRVEGQPGYIEPGMAKFRIYLSTSVENKYFIIYAYNAAGAKSSNDEHTDEIKLDMTIPQVHIQASIQGSQTQINSGDWVNGDVDIILDPTSAELDEISLSGISCERMITQTQPSDTPLKEKDDGTFQYSAVLTDLDGDILVETLMFRLMSGSGLYNFIYFDLRIDKRDIVLDHAKDLTNDQKLLEYNPADPIFGATTNPVCSDIELRFASNHTDHFHFNY